VKTIDLTPTWETAVRIYLSVLRNPGADSEAIAGAESEILRVARIADAFKNAIQHESKAARSQE
jgi:hypothetical protein